eukprot:CAMPEP_0204231062 /NCGR_PEP_ID=MMETSP0361-20130328/88442_1 /ASSEMBLY_ACC=CAM_ASM_000343 /TAXON_ID=268821 /ORGANISM="Scrippsiella Hangoei, Strain SHTV-5" /LENGTH=43 /DNA_ID= /DNA_START= /DNA_END= /DNA_ORIENTATION=
MGIPLHMASPASIGARALRLAASSTKQGRLLVDAHAPGAHDRD